MLSEVFAADKRLKDVLEREKLTHMEKLDSAKRTLSLGEPVHQKITQLITHKKYASLLTYLESEQLQSTVILVVCLRDILITFLHEKMQAILVWYSHQGTVIVL